MSSIKARRISSQERAVSFERASGKRPDPSACDRRPSGLDSHREESPELIGSEAVEDIGQAVEMF
jgi:hypothetical protein